MNALPKIFIIDLICEWIEVKDFNNLYITLKNIEFFNQIFNANLFKLSNEVYLNKWILKKNYKCSKIVIYYWNPEMVEYFENRKNILDLKLDVTDPKIEQVLLFILIISSNIKKLSINKFSNYNTCNIHFENFLTNYSNNLEYLDISNSKLNLNVKVNIPNLNVGSYFLDSIFSNCKKLKSINIEGFGFENYRFNKDKILNIKKN